MKKLLGDLSYGCQAMVKQKGGKKVMVNLGIGTGT